LLLQAGAHLGVGRGELEVLQYRPHVQAAAADEDRALPRGADALDGCSCRSLIRRYGGLFGDVQDVELVVRDAPALCARELRGADVHASIELHRIGVDDLRRFPLGKVEGEVGFTRGGGADDGDDRPVGGLDHGTRSEGIPSDTAVGLSGGAAWARCQASPPGVRRHVKSAASAMRWWEAAAVIVVVTMSPGRG